MIIDSSEVLFPLLGARRALLIMKFANTEINCNSPSQVRVASLRPDYTLHDCPVYYYFTGIFKRPHWSQRGLFFLHTFHRILQIFGVDSFQDTIFFLSQICKAGRIAGESRLLCGCTNSQQSNILIGCKPHIRFSHTVSKPTTQAPVSSATVAQPVEEWTQILEVVGPIPTWGNVFHMPTSTYEVGTELTLSVLAKRTTPM